jgi:dTDP-4-amino-4,6-dideoxygalactose transaminase
LSGKNFIPFGKPNYSDEEIKAVSRVMQSGWVGMGPETIAFEEELAAALDAPQVILVNSCTSALFLALLTHGVKAGDEVICPSLTWCSTANVALYLGAKAVFCDVDPDTMCLTPETVRAALTPRTKAVMLVHYGGLAVDPEPIRAVLPPEVAIIEDAAHALGSLYPDGRRVGASGNIACFSFYANKNLATGEGGALAVADPRLAERFRALRLHGLPTDAWKRYSQPKHVFDYQISELGYKMNYTDLQACIGRIQLRRQTEFHATRLKIAAYYHDRLSGLQPAIRFQSEVLSPGHSRHLFVIRLPIQELSLTRNELLMELRKRQIGASIHYSPLHFMPFYYQAGEEPPKLPHTEQLYEEILTLPISASLEFQEAEYIMDQMIDQFETAKMSTGPKRSIK